MAGSKEIRTKIKSVQSTRKITKAMEMVAASKMRKAQERMCHARPYGDKIRNIAAHLAHANPEYRHPFLVKNPDAKDVGVILVTSDKGLCGGMNTNALRLLTQQVKEWQDEGRKCRFTAFGNKGFSFLQRFNARIVSHLVQYGDTPHLDRLVGPGRVMIQEYAKGEIGAHYRLGWKEKERAGESLVAPDAEHRFNLPEGYRYDYGGRGLVRDEPGLSTLPAAPKGAK